MDLLRKYYHRLGKNDATFATEPFIPFFGLMLSMLTLGVIFYHIFEKQYTFNEYCWFGLHFLIFLIACVVVVGILVGFKSLMVILLKKWNVSNVNKVNALIGLGGITFVGTILATTLLFVALKRVEFYFYTIYLYYLACSLFCILFFTDINLHKGPNCDDDTKLILPSIASQVCLFILAVFILLRFDKPEDFLSSFLAYPCFASIFGISATEFIIVAERGLNTRNVVGTAEPATPKKLHDTRLECEVCHLEFSETIRIPRILKKCGHTICEKCADALLKKNNGKFLLCPFCQKMIVVNGAATSLSKNYAVIDIVRELKK